MAKITGKIVYIYPAVDGTTKSGNTFTKRDFVIATQSFDRDTGEPTIDPDNTPLLSLFGDKCAQLDSIAVGDIVCVDFSLRGRRYRGQDGKEKIITDTSVNSVRRVAMALPPVAAPAPASTASTAGTAPAESAQPKSEDDLPF